MGLGIIIGSIFLVLIIIAIPVTYLIIKGKEKELDFEEDTKIECYFKSFSKGHGEGYLQEIIQGGYTSLVKFIPSDFSRNKSIEIKPIKIQANKYTITKPTTPTNPAPNIK